MKMNRIASIFLFVVLSVFSAGSSFAASAIPVVPLVSQTKAGLAPATGAPAGKYLRDDGTWATIPGVTSFRGALVYNIGAHTAGQYIAWLSEARDTDNIHSTTTNKEYLVIPAGVSKVQFHANISFQGIASGYKGVLITKVGPGPFIGGFNLGVNDTGTSVNLNGSSAVIDVTPGEIFVVLCVSAVSAEPAGTATWLAMEIKE